MEGKSTEDLVRIAAAGGGFRVNGTRPTDDLVRMAAAAAAGAAGARIYVQAATRKSTDDLVRIAAAGHGAVVFE